MELLKTRGATQEVVDLLRQSACGWQGVSPLVCCPSVNVKTESTDKPEYRDGQLDITSPENTGSVLPQYPDCGFSNISNYRVVNGVNASLGKAYLLCISRSLWHFVNKKHLKDNVFFVR